MLVVLPPVIVLTKTVEGGGQSVTIVTEAKGNSRLCSTSSPIRERL